MELDKINSELQNIIKQMEELDVKMIDKRTEYLKAKTEYEMVYNKTIRINKLKDSKLTQTDLKAIACEEAYQLRLNMIVAESEYKKLQLEAKRLKEKLDVLKETAYNERTKTKVLRYQ